MASGQAWLCFWITNSGTMACRCWEWKLLQLMGMNWAFAGLFLVSQQHTLQSTGQLCGCFCSQGAVTLLSSSSAQVLPGAKRPLPLLPTVLHSILASETPSSIRAASGRLLALVQDWHFPNIAWLEAKLFLCCLSTLPCAFVMQYFPFFIWQKVNQNLGAWGFGHSSW